MKPLERRIEKLEAKKPDKENFVWADAPKDMTDAECRAKVDEEIGDYFDGEDFSLTIHRAHNINEFKIILASDTERLTRAMEEIGKNPKPL